MAINHLSVTAVYQNSTKMVMYGYVQSSYGEKDEDVLRKWISLHEWALTKPEMDDLVIDQMVFSNLYQQREFIDRTYGLFGIRYYCDNKDIPLTGYETFIYEEAIEDWYQMYQNVVIAGQLLPSVLFRGKEDKLQNAMTNLNRVSEQMYGEIDSKESFVSHLSTNHVKRVLMMHPLQAMAQYSREHEQLDLFRYQLFKEEKESEVNA